MCDQYPIVFDIIWALSFNQDIQQQLRASSSFMSKLAHLNKTCDNEQIRKVTNGILWNLEINHEDHLTTAITDGKTFDIMISYSHKEKTVCKQLYEELAKGGYRVWIDFDQMHGNVMDAMAQAIDRSHTIIICMSENYQKSNFCRAEAQYAFQRQRKIVPIVLQQHYKPDGWLLFLIGQLLYVNFTKYEFALAMNMLLKEIKATNIADTNVIPVCPNEDADTMPPILSVSTRNRLPSQVFSQNILEWTQAQVHDWLIEHNLLHMSRLLTNCDGRSLFHLYNYIKHGQPQQVLSLLQDDSLRRTNQSISLIELSCFHSLMDQQK